MSALTGVSAKGVARRSNIVLNQDASASTACTRHGVYYMKTLDGGARSIIVPEMPAGSDGSGPGEYTMLLTAAGARPYVEPGSYIRRHGDIYMYHVGTNGTHTTITLPSDVVKVRELFTGAEYNSNVISIDSDGPNTWLFRAATAGIWSVGDDVIAALNADGTLSIDGTGTMNDFASAADLPWDPSAVKSVTIGEGVVIGENALAGLPDSATVNGMNVGQYRKLFGGLGMSSVPEGSVVVSRTELEAAHAATIEVADGTALLGISVCTNGDLTAATSTWSPVTFRKSDLDVSADGTKIIAPIPANAEKGFMVLRSGN